MADRIEDQEITTTIPVHGLLSGASIGTWQADYPLTAIDFEYIKNGKPITFDWAISLFLTTVGFGLSVFAKYASQFTGVQQEIYDGEWIALSVGVSLSVLLYLIGLLLPNNRREVMRTIEKHFKNSPRQRQLVKEAKK